ncbi:glutamate 5-kinase [Geovibrio thiophilus]|uniref:Glutamate 5-kinase n=1 Tax=Geovibrio thiophilus TaxID=139438 RepID=A0A410JZS0_9BACT|nr:glutamate 5-kinase [Geovibrio thiophilus]QAR33561.1 glutamate 5-kinase [Geovibrio thiophilus]
MRHLPEIETLVVKIGSNILLSENEGLNLDFIRSLTESVADVQRKIKNIVIVSSGAVGAGFRHLGFSSRPKNITDRQACAAIGQARLIWLYEKEFEAFGKSVAQILITKDDFANSRRCLNARYAIRRLLEFGVVPIINENDTVVVDELKYFESFGDNDNLSALVAGLIGADLLLILSDVNGLYDKNPSVYPDAKLIHDVQYIDENLMSAAGESVSGVGTGGMGSKLKAAKKALNAGCHVGIINGRDTANISRFISGELVGTYFSHTEDVYRIRKFWIAHAASVKGTISIDAGAVKAIVDMKKSLLPSGVVNVSGRFGIGDIISVADTEGRELAKGKTRYSSKDMRQIMGKKSAEIFDILGYKFSDEIIHRDDLVVSAERGHG